MSTCDKYNQSNDEIRKLDQKGPVVIIMVGEEGDASLTMLESVIEYLCGACAGLVFLIAKKQKIFERKAPQPSDGYSFLVSLVEQKGKKAEARIVFGQNIKNDVLRECLLLVKQYHNPIFCFMRWGLDEPDNLKMQLEAYGMATTTIDKLLQSIIIGHLE